jgi:hypothetical protein
MGALNAQDYFLACSMWSAIARSHLVAHAPICFMSAGMHRSALIKGDTTTIWRLGGVLHALVIVTAGWV